MSDLSKKLSILLADTYALYLKTQNYHWHVRGPQFKTLHELFDSQYHALADAIDSLAERLRILGYEAPASFQALDKLKTIQDGRSDNKAAVMVAELAKDHATLIQDLMAAHQIAAANHDEGTMNLLVERIEEHEKARWMLEASTEN